MKKVDRSFVGSELFEKRPVVGCGVGDGNQFEIGPHLADMSDLFGELRLQRCLAGFRPKTERFQAIAFRVLETDRPTGRLAPACFLVPVGAKRNHHPVERDGAGNGFAGFRLAVHGFLLRFLPETARRFQQALQVARRRVHASQLSEEFGRFPRRAMVQDQESAVCGRVHPSIRPIVDRRERVLFRARPEIPDRTEQRGSSASVQPEPCHPREPGRPFRPGVFADHHPAQRNDPLLQPDLEIGERLGTLPFGPFLDEGCERPERLGGRGPLLDDGRKSSHRLGGHRGEFREGQTMTATLAWECS